MSEYKARCENCGGIAACRYTFGKYWYDKSHGGEGCCRPIGKLQAEAIMDAVERGKRADAAEVQETFDSAKAEAESAYAARAWNVEHLGKIHETTAKSAAAAVNNIRFILYGLRPTSSLPPFRAYPKPTGRNPISPSVAARRLALLAS